MHNHFQQIEKCLQVYAYIIKGIDKNGFEVVFASNPTNVTKHTTSTSFKELFCKQDWTQANAEDKFGTFVDEVIMQRLPARWKRGILRPKKLSVFVLTDGRWGNISSQACGMQRPIQKLIYKMKERGVEAHRTQVSIQFMRFGDEEAGIRYLDYLDQMGKAQDMDIVDTRPYDSDVYAMLIGSTNQKIDEYGETPTSPDGRASISPGSAGRL